MSLLPIVHGGVSAGAGTTGITFSSFTNNYNLRNDLINNHGYDGSSIIDVAITVNAGVAIRATSTGVPAFDINLPSGSTVLLTNNGDIVGQGGEGGVAGGIPGCNPQPGGTGSGGGNAMLIQGATVTIVNNGRIAGGGGGDGGVGGACGGTSNDPEAGCGGQTGQPGSQGAFGLPNNSTSSPPNGPGSGGGSWGTNGSTGHPGSVPDAVCGVVTGGGGAGGLAGKAISLLSGSRSITGSGQTFGLTS